MRTVGKIIQEKFDKFRLQFVEEVVFWGYRIFEKITQVQRMPPK